MPDTTDFQYEPSVVAIPSSTQQVADTVKCVSADQGKTSLTVVGGGHNLVGYAYSGNVVMLSDNMTDITIDDANKQVSVGSGQKLGNIAKAIGAKGYALPHGRYMQLKIYLIWSSADNNDIRIVPFSRC